jgi:hypothetical protein
MILNSLAGLTVVVVSAAILLGQPATIPAPPQAEQAGFRNLVLNEDFKNFDLRNPVRESVFWRPLGASISDDRYFVNDGVLTMTTARLGSKHGAVAMITTLAPTPDEPQHDFQFGYFEARLRFDWNIDNWDSFWLLSSAYKKPVEYCEIDIFEPQPTPRVYIGTVHDWSVGKRLRMTEAKIQLPRGVDFANWNTFGLLWQPGNVSWYLNNKLVATQHVPSVCDQDRLNLVLAAAKQGGDEDQRLQVNWVHVYH